MFEFHWLRPFSSVQAGPMRVRVALRIKVTRYQFTPIHGNMRLDARLDCDCPYQNLDNSCLMSIEFLAFLWLKGLKIACSSIPLVMDNAKITSYNYAVIVEMR